MEFIDIKKELPDLGEHVLTLCPKMGANGETLIIVAHLIGENDWYAGFPFDQPVTPIGWCYSLINKKSK